MQRYTKRYTDKEGWQMELKASFYIKACKRVREMLRVYPEVKQTLTLQERQKLTVDLAHHLQAVHEKEEKRKEAEAHICTRRELCRHCINSKFEAGKQTMCLATNRLISDRHRGNCDKFKEGYKNY